MEEIRDIFREAFPRIVATLIATLVISLVTFAWVVWGPSAAVLVAVVSAIILTVLVLFWIGKRKEPAKPAEPVTPQPFTVAVQVPSASPSERCVPRPPHRRVEKFIARHDEEGHDVVQRVTERLCQDCLVTIWGFGGVGKTTLALEVAHGMLPDLDGGVIWTSADGRPGFDLPFLLDEVCTHLGREDARPFPLDRKSTVACTLLGERDCLLAVDNFEAVADPQQEAIVAFLDEVPCPVLSRCA